MGFDNEFGEDAMSQRLALSVVISFRAPINAALFAFAGLFVSAPTMAQDSPPAVADDPERLALAREMPDVLNEQSKLRTELSSLGRWCKKAPPEDQPRFQQVLASMTSVFDARMPEQIDRISTIYANKLTAQEMRDALAFYHSPSGQAILKKTPVMMQEMMSRKPGESQFDAASPDPHRLALARETAEAELGVVIRSEIPRDGQEMIPAILDMMAALYARNLTEQEMQDALNFYRSPSGQSLQKKRLELMEETMSISASVNFLAEWVEAAQQDYCARKTCDDRDRNIFAVLGYGAWMLPDETRQPQEDDAPK
ncbi:MAG: DUF2059 domain-containing protein [Gallionellaceae bacterium]|jgi:hypothetical protein|nr:DUF2059 domain-containing protein [Gallionellaceae bacterium]